MEIICVRALLDPRRYTWGEKPEKDRRTLKICVAQWVHLSKQAEPVICVWEPQYSDVRQEAFRHFQSGLKKFFDLRKANKRSWSGSGAASSSQ